jgi:hypothetical protein
VLNGKIYYKIGDKMTDEIHYGYRTIWAYFHETFINKSVSHEEFSKQFYQKLIIAQLSCVKLVNNFKLIVGVSGTLKKLNTRKKEILED